MPWLSCVISNIVLALLVAVAAWFVQRRMRCPAVARILWALTLFKLVTPSLVSVPLGEPSAAMACALGTCGCEHHARMTAGGMLPWVLLGAWAIGAGATGWMAWCRWTRLRRLMAHACQAPPEWQSLAARLSAELSIRRAPEILTVPGRLPPLVVAGRSRPRMLIPMALIDRLDGSQREALMLHELVHIHRGDHLMRLLELTVSVAYWWLPIVGSIGRQLRECEEACCDAAVVAYLPQSRRDYARLLLDVLDFVNPVPRPSIPQATAMSAAQGLEDRLRTILDASQTTRGAWPVAAFALGIACVVLPCGLQYDFSRRPASRSISAGQESPATDECMPEDTPNVDRSLLLCCPS